MSPARDILRAARGGQRPDRDALRRAKIASLASAEEIEGYRLGAAWSRRALTDDERAALTRRAAEIARARR